MDTRQTLNGRCVRMEDILFGVRLIGLGLRNKEGSLDTCNRRTLGLKGFDQMAIHISDDMVNQ